MRLWGWNELLWISYRELCSQSRISSEKTWKPSLGSSKRKKLKKRRQMLRLSNRPKKLGLSLKQKHLTKWTCIRLLRRRKKGWKRKRSLWTARRSRLSTRCWTTLKISSPRTSASLPIMKISPSPRAALQNLCKSSFSSSSTNIFKETSALKTSSPRTWSLDCTTLSRVASSSTASKSSTI